MCTVWPLMSMPRIAAAAAAASSGPVASFTPPALPRPPTLTWAFTTTRGVPAAANSAAIARASAGVCAPSRQAPVSRTPRRVPSPDVRTGPLGSVLGSAAWSRVPARDILAGSLAGDPMGRPPGPELVPPRYSAALQCGVTVTSFADPERAPAAARADGQRRRFATRLASGPEKGHLAWLRRFHGWGLLRRKHRTNVT